MLRTQGSTKLRSGYGDTHRESSRRGPLLDSRAGKGTLKFESVKGNPFYFFFFPSFSSASAPRQFCGDEIGSEGLQASKILREWKLSLWLEKLWFQESGTNPYWFFPPYTFCHLASDAGIAIQSVWRAGSNWNPAFWTKDQKEEAQRKITEGRAQERDPITM